MIFFSINRRLSERSPFDGSCCGGYTGGEDTKSCSSDSEPTPPPRYRVVLLGDSATGKTGNTPTITLALLNKLNEFRDMIAQKSIILAALVNQFMTSEYMHTYDASLDDEFGEKTVSILLDGEESEMIFIDHPASEMSVSSAKCRFKLFVKALMVEI